MRKGRQGTNARLQQARKLAEEKGIPLVFAVRQLRLGGPQNPVDVNQMTDDEKAGMTGMMKARMATDAHFGNPSAQRMVGPGHMSYKFTGTEEIRGEAINVPKGWVGSHFMGETDNYAVPYIQEENGKLVFKPNASPADPESMRFESKRDASYFARNYKSIAPMSQYKDGGNINPPLPIP